MSDIVTGARIAGSGYLLGLKVSDHVGEARRGAEAQAPATSTDHPHQHRSTP